MTPTMKVCEESILVFHDMLIKTLCLQGHRRLLWLFCSDGNKDMVKYILTQPGVVDPEMEDGTTGFLMALGRQDINTVRLFLNTDFQNEHEHHQIMELIKAEFGSSSIEDFQALTAALDKSLGFNTHDTE